MALPLKHGFHGTPTYRSWCAMKSRCLNPNAHKYECYGGAGVKIHPPWLKFENFLRDMGVRPSLHHSLDRFPNPRGSYVPGNVRWATREQQNSNRITTKWITANGERLHVSDWARRLNCPEATIVRRIKLGGMTPEEAVTKPIRPCKRGADRAPYPHRGSSKG